MLLELLSITLLCMLMWIYLKWNKLSKYWMVRNVPHDPPHPIMGSLGFLQKQNPGIFMRNIFRKFPSPYVGIWLFWRPALIINSPEIARNILIKDFEVFRDRFVSSGKTDPIGALNLFTVNDPIWTSIRRRLSAIFTSAKLKVLIPLFVKKSKELCQRIENVQQNKEPMDLRTIFTDYTTDVIGSASFGVECNATLTGEDPMRTVTKEFMNYNFFRGLCWSSIFFFPNIVDYCNFSFFPKPTTNYFTKTFQTIVKNRKNDVNTPGNRDLLDALLKMKEDAKNDNEEISEELLIAQAAIFVQGGFDTSGSVLTMASYELAYQPDIQDKLYEELAECRNSSGGKDFDSQLIHKLPLLNAVLKEVLRKYPNMGWLDRIASTNYKIDENLTITKGTPIYINAIGMHYDPILFPDPLKFDPSRFYFDNEKLIKPFTYMPFGEGPRMCIGQRFGMYTTRFALAYLIYNYKLRMPAGALAPNEVEIEKRGLFYTPVSILTLNFEKRHSSMDLAEEGMNQNY